VYEVTRDSFTHSKSLEHVGRHGLSL
jgi:hypothetical protein